MEDFQENYGFFSQTILLIQQRLSAFEGTVVRFPQERHIPVEASKCKVFYLPFNLGNFGPVDNFNHQGLARNALLGIQAILQAHPGRYQLFFSWVLGLKWGTWNFTCGRTSN